MLIDELGIGTAARGQDFNAILYRANPALALARQVIGDPRPPEGAARRDHRRDQHDRGRRRRRIPALRSSSSIAPPRLLDHRSPSLEPRACDPPPARRSWPPRSPRSNNSTWSRATVRRCFSSFVDLRPGSTASHSTSPACGRRETRVAKLTAALDRAIPAIRQVTPLVGTLRSYTHRSLPKTKLSGRLFTSLQDSGFLENFLGIMYYVGASLSHYDSTSHLLDIALEDIHNGACLTYATTPVAGCSANYGSTSASPASAHTRSASAQTRSAAQASPHTASTATSRSLQSLIGYLLR